MTEYEAVQERPVYWDGARIEKQPLSSRSKDWRMATKRIAKTFPEFVQAEAYARRLLGQRPGVPVEIFERFDVQRGAYRHTDSELVAIVSRDALGRTWTDAMTMEGMI